MLRRGERIGEGGRGRGDGIVSERVQLLHELRGERHRRRGMHRRALDGVHNVMGEVEVIRGSLCRPDGGAEHTLGGSACRELEEVSCSRAQGGTESGGGLGGAGCQVEMDAEHVPGGEGGAGLGGVDDPAVAFEVVLHGLETKARGRGGRAERVDVVSVSVSGGGVRRGAEGGGDGLVEAEGGPGHAHREAGELEDAMGRGGDTEETTERGVHMQLVIGGREVQL